MINLLPENEKKILSEEKSKKLVMVLGGIILIGFVCLFLVLLSVKFYILGQISAQEFLFKEIEKESQLTEFSTFKALMLKYNNNLARINSFYKDQLNMGGALNILLEIPRPGVYFTGISMNPVKNSDKIQIILSGARDTRDNLTIFKDNIAKEKRITSAYFPPGSWLNSKDINFNITLEFSDGN